MTVEVLELGFFTAMLSAFLIGVSFGSGPCNLSCLPYLGPVLLGPAASRPFSEALLPFMTGRLFGYLLLGVLAGLFGQVVQKYLEHPSIPLLAAGVTMWLALKLWKQAQSPRCESHLKASVQSSSQTSENLIATDQRGDLVKATFVNAASNQLEEQKSRPQLFILGFSLALNPCIPLLGLLSSAAQSASWVWGGSIAFSFGLGAIVIPTLLVRYGVALLAKEIRSQLSNWQAGLTRTGALMLLLVAFNTAWRGMPV